MNNITLEILKDGTNDMKRVYKLYKDGELVEGNTAKFRHQIEGLKIRDLDDCGTCNDDIAVIEGFESWYTERKGDVYYSFQIRQLTERDAIVYMFRFDMAHQDRRGSYTWVRLPAPREEETKITSLEKLLGFQPGEVDKILDDFFFKDIREFYKKHGKEVPDWMHF